MGLDLLKVLLGMRSDLLGGTCSDVVADLLIIISTVNSDGLNKSNVLGTSPSTDFLSFSVSFRLACVLLTILFVRKSHLDVTDIDLFRTVPVLSLDGKSTPKVVFSRYSSFCFPLNWLGL